MSKFSQEQALFEHMSGCLVDCEHALFECVRERSPEGCQSAYSHCEDLCEHGAPPREDRPLEDVL